MVRLTPAMKDSILRNLIHRRFQKQKDELDERSRELADGIYKTVYTKSQIDKMNDLPKGWLEEKDYIEVTIGGEFCRFTFPLAKNGNPEKRRFLAKDCSGACDVFEASSPVGRWRREIESDYKTYKSKRDEAKALACAAPAPYTTVGALLKAWPEVEEFVNVGKQVQLPTIPIKKLNSLFDLPPKQGEPIEEGARS